MNEGAAAARRDVHVRQWRRRRRPHQIPAAGRGRGRPQAAAPDLVWREDGEVLQRCPAGGGGAEA
jgi:hypothetical protein